MTVDAPYHTAFAQELMFEWGEAIAFASTPDLVNFKEALLRLMAEEGERDDSLPVQEQLARFIYRRYSEVHPNAIRSQMFKFVRAKNDEDRLRAVQGGRNAPPSGPYWWELAPSDTAK